MIMKKMMFRQFAVAAVMAITMLGFIGSAAVRADEAKTAEAEIILQKADDFKTVVLQSPIPCLVDFYADWCPPCQQMSPILSKIAKTWQGKIKVVKVNVDKFEALAQQYKVEGIPDVRIFSGGKQIEQYVGFRDESEWTELIGKLMQK